jgi:hypothetical protein
VRGWLVSIGERTVDVESACMPTNVLSPTNAGPWIWDWWVMDTFPTDVDGVRLTADAHDVRLDEVAVLERLERVHHCRCKAGACTTE